MHIYATLDKEVPAFALGTRPNKIIFELQKRLFPENDALIIKKSMLIGKAGG